MVTTWTSLSEPYKIGDYTEAFDNLLEELADVLLVSKILLIEETKERIYQIMNKKLGRWTSRLKKVD